MQQPDDSIPVPAVTPPTLDPATWEDFQGFRETFLLHFPGARENAALRIVTDLLYGMILEAPELQPLPPEGTVRTQIRAAVADLRFLQGFLASLEQEAEGSCFTDFEEHLCRFAAARSAVLKQAADEIEEQLGSWRGGIGA